jgi:hypothetical protein
MRRKALVPLQEGRRITLSDNPTGRSQLACLLFQAGALSRGEPREFEQEVKISSDYFDKVSNTEQSQHLGKPYGIALANGS